MNAFQASKRVQKAFYKSFQQLEYLHTAGPVHQGRLWDAVRKACGVSEQKILREKGYRYAEDSARAQLAEQLQSKKGFEGDVLGAENLNSDMAGDETMTNNMTAYRSWKIDNASVIEEREEIRKEEKSNLGN